jgi:RNA polymerase sigma-70 factor (sigma-B/F/G subfamily)
VAVPTVLGFSGVLDFGAAVRLRLALFERLDAGDIVLVVDLSRVRLLDASAVAALLRVQGFAEQRGGSLRIIGATGLVLETLEITGAAKALGVHDETASDLGLEWHVPAEVTDEHTRWTLEVSDLLHRANALPADDPRRQELREEAVSRALPYAERLARRFQGLGEPLDDLLQVAALGLLKAIDRFDPAVGADFASYAAPTISGELKRHFRDKGWSVHVPRRLQELRLEINRARDEMAQHLGRPPTAQQLADDIGVDVEQIIEALVASAAYRPVSLNAPLSNCDDEAVTLLDVVGNDDPGLDAVDFHESLQPALATLPAREQKIIALRFYGNLTQAQIAAELGISQMHVSRLLARGLAALRAQIFPADPARLRPRTA